MAVAEKPEDPSDSSAEELAARYLAQKSQDGDADPSTFREELTTEFLKQEFDELLALADTAARVFPLAHDPGHVPEASPGRSERSVRRRRAGLVAAVAILVIGLGSAFFLLDRPVDSVQAVGLHSARLTMVREANVLALVVALAGANKPVAAVPVRPRLQGTATSNDGPWSLRLPPGEHALEWRASPELDAPDLEAQPRLWTVSDDRLEVLWQKLGAQAELGRDAIPIAVLERLFESLRGDERGGGVELPLSLAQLVGDEPITDSAIVRLVRSDAER